MLCVYVATHKKIDYSFPSYCKKVQINVANTSPWEGYIHDNSMCNISVKNPYYCELTALYHLWKNNESDYKGLYHYRRLFGMTDSNGMKLYYPKSYPFNEVNKKTIDESRILKILETKDIILPVPNNPFPAISIEALSKFVSNENIRLLISIIEEKYPEYLSELWGVLTDNQISYCNVFIASKNLFNAYCGWLFDVLSDIENKVKKDDKGNPPKRIFGYLSEILLNVYVRKNKLKIHYLDLITFYDSSNRTMDKLIAMKKRFVDTLLLFGINPSLFNIPFRRICSCKSLLLQGQKLKFDSYTDPLDSIMSFYRKIGAHDIQRKRTSGVEYIVAKMDYKTANECFLSIYYDNTFDEEVNYKELHDRFSQINNIEASSEFTLIDRVFVAKNISLKEKKSLFGKGITPIEMKDTFFDNMH